MAPLSRTLLALASCLFSVSALVIPPLGGSITNVKIGPNTDGKAVCASGTVSVTVSATNAKIAQQNPKDQFELSEIIQEFVSVNSDLVARNIIGTQPVQSSFNIYGTLCYPNSAPDIQSVKTLQILSHGAGLDRSYWDVASGNSYVGAAATAGYATFAYDRLGVGQSSHPDPIQVVQPATEVEILNQLLQGFKTGKIGAQKFANVVGVGHSVGSVIQTAHDAKYPNQFNATVITGLATNFPALSYTIIGTTPQIAAQANPSKFSGLPSGYIIEPNTIAFQQPFFRYPNFDPKGKLWKRIENFECIKLIERSFPNTVPRRSTADIGSALHFGWCSCSSCSSHKAGGCCNRAERPSILSR